MAAWFNPCHDMTCRAMTCHALPCHALPCPVPNHAPPCQITQVRVLCSNNDDMVRAFDSETFQLVRCALGGGFPVAGQACALHAWWRCTHARRLFHGMPAAQHALPASLALPNPVPPRPLPHPASPAQPAAAALGCQLHGDAARQLPAAADGGGRPHSACVRSIQRATGGQAVLPGMVSRHKARLHGLTVEIVACLDVQCVTPNAEPSPHLCPPGPLTSSVLQALTSRHTKCPPALQVAQLKGHLDYSFAAAWHPDGNVVATGNQVG